MHTHIHYLCIHMYIYIYIHTHTVICVDIYTYIYIHTHDTYGRVPKWGYRNLLIGGQRHATALRTPLHTMFTVPQKGYAKRGSNCQITKKSLFSHF